MSAKLLDDLAQACRVLLNDFARLLQARHLGRRLIFIKGRFLVGVIDVTVGPGQKGLLS
jgi:hypothetical protein